MSATTKNLLLVLPEAFNSTGGIQMFCRSLCMAAGRWAKARGGSVSALVLNDSTAPDARYVNGGFRSYDGAAKNKRKLVNSYVKQLRKNRYDWIIFGHVSLSPLAIFARALQPQAKTAVVAYGKEVWRPLPTLQRNAVGRADVILSISDHTKEELWKLNAIPQDKIKVFPCALDPLWNLETTVQSTESQPPLLLSVARMSQAEGEKGIDSVIRSLPYVLSHIGPVEYRIVGEGDDVPRLMALALKLGVERQVVFEGEVPDAELRELYQRCSVFVLPSKQEGFGIVFLEAMAYAKPVIGGVHGGTPFVVKDRETGWLVDHSDLAGIGEAIVMFLRDPELRAKVGAAGRDRLSQRFTFAAFEHNLDQILSLN